MTQYHYLKALIKNSIQCITEVYASSVPSICPSLPCSRSGHNDDIKEIEHYVIVLHERISELSDVNETRKQMFCSGKQIENIPPSKAAMGEHIQ